MAATKSWRDDKMYGDKKQVADAAINEDIAVCALR
jgi:hypothetical protein